MLPAIVNGGYRILPVVPAWSASHPALFGLVPNDGVKKDWESLLIELGRRKRGVLLALPWIPHLTPWPDQIQGEGVIMAVGIPMVMVLLYVHGRGLARFLIAPAVGMTVMLPPYSLITIQNLNEIMSP